MSLANFVLENTSELRESIVRHNVRDVVLHGARTRVIGEDVQREFEGVGESRLVNSYGLAEIHEARVCVERQVVGDAAEQINDKTLASWTSGH